MFEGKIGKTVLGAGGAGKVMEECVTKPNHQHLTLQ